MPPTKVLIPFDGGGGGRDDNHDDKGVIVTAMPVPGAAWLFGSGLLGLLGVGCSRRRSRVA